MRQRTFERSLVKMGLGLGEYMELVERAFLEAHALKRAGILPDEPELQPAALRIAAKLTASYTRRKRLFVLLSALGNLGCPRAFGSFPQEVRAADFPESVPSWVAPASSGGRKQQLRRRIHRRLEEIKRGGA